MLRASSHETFVFILVLGITLLGTVRIISTYSVFNHTFDEPAHIACGLEWLDQGTYNFEPLHPPLARVAAALGPYLDGLRSTGARNMWREGLNILYARENYFRNLTMARLGILPFFFLANVVIYVWSRQLFNKSSGLIAIILFTSLPPVLAHSGLATTDAPLMATLVSAVAAFAFWLAKPTVTRSFILGLTAALAILSKFSSVVFLPSCIFAITALFLLLRKRTTEPAKFETRKILSYGTLVVFISFFVIWAGYGFSTKPLTTVKDRPHLAIDNLVGTEGTLHDFAYTISEIRMIPLFDLAKGILHVVRHNRRGDKNYLLGEIRQYGWWYFFPVVFAVKTPLGFLILALVGFAMLLRQGFQQKNWQFLAPAVCAPVILLVCMTSRINFGVRHLLPIYPFLVIVAAFGVAGLWRIGRFNRASRILVVILMAWCLTTSVLSHPDYLPYFNELVGSHPEEIRIDSDLDWGQDLQRLSQTLEILGIDEVSLSYFGTARVHKHNMPVVRNLVPYQPATGWIAISLHNFKVREGFSWLEDYKPVALVGKSINLFYIPTNERKISSDIR
jgi:hypothetical protein